MGFAELLEVVQEEERLQLLWQVLLLKFWFLHEHVCVLWTIDSPVEDYGLDVCLAGCGDKLDSPILCYHLVDTCIDLRHDCDAYLCILHVLDIQGNTMELQLEMNAIHGIRHHEVACNV